MLEARHKAVGGVARPLPPAPPTAAAPVAEDSAVEDQRHQTCALSVPPPSESLSQDSSSSTSRCAVCHSCAASTIRCDRCQRFKTISWRFGQQCDELALQPLPNRHGRMRDDEVLRQIRYHPWWQRVL